MTSYTFIYLFKNNMECDITYFKIIYFFDELPDLVPHCFPTNFTEWQQDRFHRSGYININA